MLIDWEMLQEYVNELYKFANKQESSFHSVGGVNLRGYGKMSAREAFYYYSGQLEVLEKIKRWID